MVGHASTYPLACTAVGSRVDEMEEDAHAVVLLEPLLGGDEAAAAAAAAAAAGEVVTPKESGAQAAWRHRMLLGTLAFTDLTARAYTRSHFRSS